MFMHRLSVMTLPAVLALAPLRAQSPAAPAAEPAPAAPQQQQEPATPPADAAAATQETENKEVQLRLAKMALEKARLDTELDIAALKSRVARADSDTERLKLETESAVRASRLALDLAGDDELKADAERTLNIAALKAAIAEAERNHATRETELRTKLAKLENDNAIARINAEVARYKSGREAARVVTGAPRKRAAEPFADGTLTISDRRIVINSLINDEVARRVIERINFFNAADAAAPVFIVIETSPGASTFAGYQVLKAIESSRAPVHVLVRGFTGGLTTTLVALSPHSYAVPGAVLVLNQPEVRARGNVTVAREHIDNVTAFHKRLNERLCAKIGVKPEELTKLMYAHDSEGDWRTFGDRAVKQKIVDLLVTKVVDESVDNLMERPETMDFNYFRYTDPDGKTRIELPPLCPGDSWQIHDAEGIFGQR